MRPSDQRRCPWPETHCPALAGTHCASDAAGAAISFPCWHDGAKQRSFGLTPREIEIVSTVVAGYSNKEIAEYFKIAEDTVKHHLIKIFDKVGVLTRLELALFAVNQSLPVSEI